MISNFQNFETQRGLDLAWKPALRRELALRSACRKRAQLTIALSFFASFLIGCQSLSDRPASSTIDRTPSKNWQLEALPMHAQY
jgi:hypothetical protein